MEANFGSKPIMCFEIEKVIGVSSDESYQVQWAPAWVSKYHLVGCEHLIQEFLLRQEKEEIYRTRYASSPESPGSSIVRRETANEHIHSNEVIMDSENSPVHVVIPAEPNIEDTATVVNFENTKNDENVENMERVENCDGQQEKFDYNRYEDKFDDRPGTTHGSDGVSNVCIKVEEDDEGTDNNKETAAAEQLPQHRSTMYIRFKEIVDPSDLTNNQSPSFVSNPYITTTKSITNTNTGNSDESIEQLEDSEQGQQLAAYQIDNQLSTINDNRCPICNKREPYRSKLERHIRTHTGVKPFQCSQCDRTFSRRDHLKDHEKRYHSEGYVKPFTCDVCGKGFHAIRDLHAHRSIHVRKHTCSVCGSMFASRSLMKEHSKTCKSDFNSCV